MSRITALIVSLATLLFFVAACSNTSAKHSASHPPVPAVSATITTTPAPAVSPAALIPNTAGDQQACRYWAQAQAGQLTPSTFEEDVTIYAYNAGGLDENLAQQMADWWVATLDNGQGYLGSPDGYATQISAACASIKSAS